MIGDRIILSPISRLWNPLSFQWFVFLISRFSNAPLACDESRPPPNVSVLNQRIQQIRVFAHSACPMAPPRDPQRSSLHAHTVFLFLTAKRMEMWLSTHWSFLLEMTHSILCSCLGNTTGSRTAIMFTLTDKRYRDFSNISSDTAGWYLPTVQKYP